jgi:hypothetical protein
VDRSAVWVDAVLKPPLYLEATTSATAQGGWQTVYIPSHRKVAGGWAPDNGSVADANGLQPTLRDETAEDGHPAEKNKDKDKGN